MVFSQAARKLSSCLLAVFVLLSGGRAHAVISDVAASESPAPPTIIFGFVGGFVRHNDMVHSVVQLAADLRKEYPTGTVIETFENHSGEDAHKRILSLLDANHDGTLSAEEKRNAHIILYGHSWGASELVTLARRLGKEDIPVLLTVQVDSVPKLGENDIIIPANVAQAVNYYQADGLLHGEPEIRAADKSRTRILGNFRFSYATTPYGCANYPWYARIFMKAHTQIECDSKVWGQVEALIRSNLPPATRENSAR